MMIRKPKQTNVKRLVIKSLVNVPKLPENFYEESWKRLATAVQAIHDMQPISDSMESLYNVVKDLCLHKFSKQTYDNVREQYTKFMQQQANSILQLLDSGVDTTSLLTKMKMTWESHCNHIRMIRDIFLYLDRTYVNQTNDRSFWEMGCTIFRTSIMMDVACTERIVQGILELIENDRKRQTIERSLLQSLSRMFISLQMYKTHIETPFIKVTESFYSVEGVNKLSENSVTFYLNYTESCFHDEAERLQLYLNTCTKAKLTLVLEETLIKNHELELLEKGFFQLMEQDDRTNLKKFYHLLHRIKSYENILEFTSLFVKKIVLDLVTLPSKDASMIEDLFSLKEKLDGIWRECFGCNSQFLDCMKGAFKESINKRKNTPAELLAKHIDKVLQRGSKHYTEEEIEAKMDNTVIFFRYVESKDMFQAFFKQKFAKRLLIGKLINYELENMMISKLKIECGSGFTSKLEGMITDIDVSKELCTTFQNEVTDLPFEMNVHVLTMGTWPTFKPVDVLLPSAFTTCQEAFVTYYQGRHNGRKLTWQNFMGHCSVNSIFPNGKSLITMSLLQAIIMLQFNDGSKFTFAQLGAATNICEKELKTSLLPLFASKIRLLVKSPKGSAVEADSVFYFNKLFKPKLNRLQINQIQMKETKEERKETTGGVIVDRQYQIDAAIVRIMKTRKSLSHNLLVSALFDQLRFPVEPVAIKKRIESLLDREYLERDEEKSQVYRYLA